MKTTDLKPLMVFHQVSDFAGGPDVVIDEVLADANGPHSVVCRAVGIAHPTDELPFTVDAKEIVDARKWSFEPVLTTGTMHAKILYLQDYVRRLKQAPGKLSPDDLRAAILSCNACGASLKQGEMMVCAVCDAALGTKVTPVEGKPNTFNYEFNTKPRPPPHEYAETNPYKGCAVCGFGPGAYQHNSAAIREANDLKVNPDGSIPMVDGREDLERRATKFMQKATLEKARRIQLMGRVDELKAALGDAKQGFELELPGQWPERFNVLLELEPPDPKDWTPRYDYKAKPTSPLSWPKGDPKRWPTAEELVRVEPLDPFAELSAVLWFLASLTSDHEPGCVVKDGKGEPCDCDVTLREGEPWWRRVRASLSLPAALKGRLEKAETLLKARRVVQVTPVAGVPGPNGDGTVYEFKMPTEDVQRLLVLRHEPGTVVPQQMRDIAEGLRKKLPGLLVLFAQPNWELTLLELPK